MKILLPTLFHALGLFLTLSLNAQQRITNLTITPATPGTCDSVMVTVDGNLPATNYVYAYSQLHVSGSLITLNFFCDSQGLDKPTITSLSQPRQRADLVRYPGRLFADEPA